MTLPGPRLDVAPWSRLAALPAALSRRPDAEAGEPPTDARAEVTRLRALVGEGLAALARRIDEALPPALAHARKAWDKVDDLTIVDAKLEAALADARRWLEAAALDGTLAARAVALEGLLALDTARGLTALCERRLSSLIRLRVRAQEDDLLPGGRPFLDLGSALAEVARAWA